MAMEFPELGEADLVAELQHVHRTSRRALDTAFYGRGDVPSLYVDLPQGAVSFRVVPVRSEIELRRALVTRDARRLVALVSYDAGQLPLDLAARLAHGEVRQVSSESRLRRHFHVSWIHPDVRKHRALCDALLMDPAAALPPGAAQLDPESAWRLMLSARCGLTHDAAFTLRRLLVHLATSSPSPRWTDWMREHTELRAPFEVWLSRSVDPIAPALWAAWEERRGPAVASLTFLLGPLGSRLSAVPLLRVQALRWIERVSGSLGARLADDMGALVRWGECERPLHDALLHAHPRVLDATLREADQLVADAAREPDLRAALATSEHLALAWDEARRALAEALDAVRTAPDRERFVAAVTALGRLERHRSARSDARTVLRARAGLRLVGWMAARADLTHFLSEGAPWQPAMELARDYVTQGAFADLSRRQVRGSAEGLLGRALGAIELEADTRRDDDDRLFATALRAFSDHGRRDEQVVSIERALDVFAVPFLQQASARRLLVILLDGAAWANVIELLLDLEDRHHHGVMRWQPARGVTTSFVPPVLAALPTVTQVSRAAFFGGRVPEPGDRPDSSLDPRRFSAHPGLRACLPSGTPKLLLEPDVQIASGHCSPEALSLVRSEGRVVAVVLNAIDDQLHGSRQVEVSYTVDTIKPLAALLAAARESGRAVLLASDHGHVPGARLRSVAPHREHGDARWRVLDDGETPDPGELLFRGAGVWTPRKGQQVALRTRETEVRGAAAGDGQHGGVTLAEVVSPTVFVVSETLRDTSPELHDDAALDAWALPRPAWWDLQWPARPTRTPERAAASVVQAQLPLIAVSPTPVVTAPRPTTALASKMEEGPRSRLGRAILEAETFKGLSEDRRRRLRELVVPVVELLQMHGGQMAPAALARGLQQLPGRGEQICAAASEVLNIDGYPVLAHDVVEDLVRLDVATLRELLDLRETT